MPIIAGDVKQVTFDHDEKDSFNLQPKSGADSTFSKGGFKSDDDDANITSGGNRIDKMTRIPWMFEIEVGADDITLDQIQEATQNPVEGTLTVTYMSGMVRVGRGKPVGDVVHNTQQGTMTVKFQGGGTFDQ